jgi:hypothetical protein
LSQDARAIEAAREDVKLAARQTVDVLHHLSDFVLKEPSPTLRFAKIEDVRNAVEARCVFLRTASSRCCRTSIFRWTERLIEAWASHKSFRLFTLDSN